MTAIYVKKENPLRASSHHQSIIFVIHLIGSPAIMNFHLVHPRHVYLYLHTRHMYIYIIGIFIPTY